MIFQHGRVVKSDGGSFPERNAAYMTQRNHSARSRNRKRDQVGHGMAVLIDIVYLI